ncbi:hypothetical protein J1N35_000760 [Gossypium stocksii]|uniref:Uncharacterized protein n=1 Tax=Gossypium stocksii TaxID=47602 RepID=A0A9D3WHP1_9ROSI|nr:hypothetical protein J1N35_000760 [Gossypium stocksii]
MFEREITEAKMMKAYLSLAIIVLVLYNSMNPCRAMSMKTNTSGTSSLIADNKDLEFLMDSHSGRILAGTGGPGTGNTVNSGQPIADCGRGFPYKSCFPDKNPSGPKPENPGVYNRGH